MAPVSTPHPRGGAGRGRKCSRGRKAAPCHTGDRACSAWLESQCFPHTWLSLRPIRWPSYPWAGKQWLPWLWASLLPQLSSFLWSGARRVSPPQDRPSFGPQGICHRMICVSPQVHAQVPTPSTSTGTAFGDVCEMRSLEWVLIQYTSVLRRGDWDTRTHGSETI